MIRDLTWGNFQKIYILHQNHARFHVNIGCFIFTFPEFLLTLLLIISHWQSDSDQAAVKNPLSIQETKEMRVGSLDQEDPLAEKTATRPSILAQKIPWTVEPGRPISMGSQKVGHAWSNWAYTRTVTWACLCVHNIIPSLHPSWILEGMGSCWVLIMCIHCLHFPLILLLPKIKDHKLGILMEPRAKFVFNLLSKHLIP